MTSRQTELRRDVQHLIAELIQGALDVGEFTMMEYEEQEYGHTTAEMRAEIIRQQEIMRRRSSRS